MMATYSLQEVLAATAIKVHLMAQPRYRDRENLVACGDKIFSQADEDGIIFEIFRRIEPDSRSFLEIGVEGGLENNTLALLLSNWRGTWVEGNEQFAQAISMKFAKALEDGRLQLLRQFVDLSNLATMQSAWQVSKSLDLLSIDIDGNDFHIAPALLAFLPRVVVVEYNARFGARIDWVMPYDPSHRWDGSDYFGASLAAWCRLFDEHGYGLVSCNLLGTNAFFVRRDCLGNRFDRVDDPDFHFEPARYFLLPAFQIAHPPDTRPHTSYV